METVQKTHRKKTLQEDSIIELLSRGAYEPRILVVGCGGAGCRMVNKIDRRKPRNVTTMAINTDQHSMEKIQADKKIIIGRDVTDGSGAGGFWEVGYYAASNAKKLIAENMKGADIAIIVAGTGGGTGAGASPVIGSIAKKMGIVPIGILMTPFTVEKDRYARSGRDIERFRNVVDSCIVLDNNRLLKAENMTFGRAMEISVNGIINIIERLKNTINSSFVREVSEELKSSGVTSNPTPAVMKEVMPTMAGRGTHKNVLTAGGQERMTLTAEMPGPAPNIIDPAIQ